MDRLSNKEPSLKREGGERGVPKAFSFPSSKMSVVRRRLCEESKRLGPNIEPKVLDRWINMVDQSEI